MTGGLANAWLGQVLEISFPRFTPRITFQSERELTVAIVAGDNAGFEDTVEYESLALRDDLILLSWQEHIGSTVVHILDLTTLQVHTFVTRGHGGCLRLRGTISLDLQDPTAAR